MSAVVHATCAQCGGPVRLEPDAGDLGYECALCPGPLHGGPALCSPDCHDDHDDDHHLDPRCCYCAATIALMDTGPGGIICCADAQACASRVAAQILA